VKKRINLALVLLSGIPDTDFAPLIFGVIEVGVENVLITDDDFDLNIWRSSSTGLWTDH